MNHYSADVTLKHHMVQSHQGALQAEARMARLLREAAQAPEESTPQPTRVAVSRNRLAGALAGLVLTLGLLVGTALAEQQDAAPADDAGQREQVTRRVEGNRFIE